MSTKIRRGDVVIWNPQHDVRNPEFIPYVRRRGIVWRLYLDHLPPQAVVIYKHHERRGCTWRYLALPDLVPVGHVKRVPSCSGLSHPASVTLDRGRWVRPTNRSLRTRQNEVGAQIRRLENTLHAAAPDVVESWRRGVESRLVRLDDKLERMDSRKRRTR